LDEKVSDILRHYLNPTDKAIVNCFEENTQIQALDRTQPLLPMGLCDVAGVTHDTIRFGPNTLFAGLDVATGSVIATPSQETIFVLAVTCGTAG
jgi:hypothetical protein